MFSFHIYNAISMLQYKDNIVFIISMSGEDATFLSGTRKLQLLSFRMEDYELFYKILILKRASCKQQF